MTTRPAAGPHFDTALLGRTSATAQLVSGLESAVAGHGRLIMVTGDAGIGKTGSSIVPLMLTMRVRCTEDGQDLGALIGNGYVLNACLFVGVGWLAILNWLRVRAGQERAAADSTTLWSLGLIVLIAPIEAVMSFSSMEQHCAGNGAFRAAHLALPVVVLVVGAATRPVERVST